MIGTRPYHAGGGHLWLPGEDEPESFDCSGFTFYEFLSELGIDLRNSDEQTTSETQWNDAKGGRILHANGLLLGQLIYFTDHTYADPGHVGVITSIAKSGSGTYVSAYSTALGIVEEPWTWGAGSFYGVTDPIATLIPITPMEGDMLLIVTNPNNNGQAVLNLADGTYFGFPNGDMLSFYKENGVPVAKRQPSKAEWAKFTQKGTI